MARKSKEECINFNNVREVIRTKIIEKYGSVANFLHSEKGKELGGYKMKVYLYSTGPINYDYISTLCNYFNIGKLQRQIHVTRTYTYKLLKTQQE